MRILAGLVVAASVARADPMPPEEHIRVVSAPKIREVSARGIEPVHALPAPIADNGKAAWAHLPAPHLLGKDAPLPAVHEPGDLRALVGRRERHDATSVVCGWSRALGSTLEPGPPAQLIARAEA